MSGVAHQDFLETRHFASLDGLRCLSIVPVVWHHCQTSAPGGILGKGAAGVQLFFALSGFLITTLLLRERDGGGIALGAFYARRSLRIFPLYYAVLALTTAYVALVAAPGPSKSHFFASLPFHATFTSNWMVDWDVPHPIVFAFSWSLATEEQFYLVWPWLLRYLRGLLAPAAVMGAFLLLDHVASGAFPALFPPDEPHTVVAASFSSAIGLGSLLALVLHHPRGHALFRRAFGSLLVVPVLLALLLLELYSNRTPHFWFHLTLVALVGATVVRPDHALAGLFQARVVIGIGRVSYGIYLLHVAVVALVRWIVPARETLFVFAFAMPLSVGLAWLSYHAFEMPLRRFQAPKSGRFSLAVAAQGGERCP
jgi:peptidoglycan/LPS O-acetylase OafA/YrhL